MYQCYIIAKTLPTYKFKDVLQMPYILKELLYQIILYDYGSDENDDNDVVNLDEATPKELDKLLGAFK